MLLHSMNYKNISVNIAENGHPLLILSFVGNNHC
jgi:hypothetical protein